MRAAFHFKPETQFVGCCRIMSRLILPLSLLLATVRAFAPLPNALLVTRTTLFAPPSRTAGTSALLAKFDGEKWVAESDQETAAAGYGIFPTFVRHGPRPTLQRILQPDDYDQAVLKFMALESVDRLNAQGNIDAFLRNEQDWAYNRMQEEKRGFRIDYYTVNPKDVILVLVWSTGLSLFAGRAIYSVIYGVDFVSTCSILPYT